jgi:hypothetical protein
MGIVESGEGRDALRTVLWSVLAVLIAIACLAIGPSAASAASCPVNPGNATSWIGGSGDFGNDANWSNGTPTGTCDVTITPPGSPTITMTGGANAKSVVLGGSGSTPTLVISSQSPNTNLDAQPAGMTIAAGASVVLTCPASPGECLGGPAGGAGLATGSSPLANAGTIKVDSNSGTGASVSGAITNTGTMTFEKTASLGGAVVNQGAVVISSGATVTNSGSSCGGTEVFFKNDTGGALTANGTGFLSVINYEQGNGSVGGTSPVPINVPCGSVKFTGNGTGKVQATGGFNLTGEIQSNQSLTVLSQSNNPNAVLGGNLTNNGAITLSCDPGGCNGGPGGGAGFNISDKDFVNAGTFTVAAASGTGASITANTEGTITNTGTMSFDQSAALHGPFTNQGAVNIANERSITSGGGCSGGPVKNDTGGSINATGNGTFYVGNYEQGNGVTSGANPVQLYGGCLKYSSSTGVGASKVLAFAGFNLTGELQAAQALTVSNDSANTNLVLMSPFTSNGSITFTCPSPPCNGPGFNGNGNPFTNMGTFTVTAAASGGTNLDRSSGGMTNAAAGTFQISGQASFNGSGPFSNQGTIQIVGGANMPAFTNEGTVVLNQSGTSPFLNTGTLTNAGTITTSGASANASSLNGTVDQTGASAQTIVPAGTKLALNNALLLKAGTLSGGGTLQGSVNNSGGTVLPGSSPGTLTVSGDYTQGAGGTLEAELEGAGAGQFDRLSVGGNANLDGTVSLLPSAGYAASAVTGDNLAFLTYGGSRSGEFASTTFGAPLACPNQLAVAYDDEAKSASARVSSSGATCTPPGNGEKPSASAPNTKLGRHPKGKLKTKKSKVKVKFTFSADIAGSAFECKLDKGKFTACSSPKSYKVKPGKHKFTVRAKAGGVVDPSPASFSFKVVKKKPKKR